MDLASFLQFIRLNFDVDLEKRLITVQIGPVTLRNVTVPQLQQDEDLLEVILSRCFIQRRVMWEDYGRETLTLCIKSLHETKDELERLHEKFPRTSPHRSPLQAWANQCKEAADVLRTAWKEQYEPDNSSIGMDAHEWIPDILGALRKASYPTVEMMIDLLPDKSHIKSQAQSKLEHGTEVAVKYFHVPIRSMSHPTVTL